jgi:hypothetical protein
MATKKEMREWFTGRYETAGEALFHDSSEGGFQYPPGSGGPLNVNTILQEHFPDEKDLEVIEELAPELEDEGPWVDMEDDEDENK